MKRRGFFLGATVTLVAAPTIVRADALMRWSVIDPLTINPPDFWMRPSTDMEIDDWQAGWWQPQSSADIGNQWPLPDRFEVVPHTRVPWRVRHNGRDITMLRQPVESNVKPDVLRRYEHVRDTPLFAHSWIREY